MKVRIVQLLCPQRHCIMAMAYESPDGQQIPEISERLREAFRDWVARGGNPWCGLCHSRKLEAEDRPTHFRSMQEAMPFLQAEEAKQALTREYFRASRG
jgi:hypothetical protein